MARAYLVGSGIAALAAATFLIRDGGFKGSDIHRTSTVVPCVMPYITSQFLARRRDDRPRVVPEGSVNLAFTRATTTPAYWPPPWKPCTTGKPPTA
ncbi:oleate hydratase [Streptomyces graminilatus]|uniref:oleate hydratase n=1 Tax=Streptomyces graminilatus TaxID=1464070 RepID=UPI0006E12E35